MVQAGSREDQVAYLKDKLEYIRKSVKRLPPSRLKTELKRVERRGWWNGYLAATIEQLRWLEEGGP